MDDSKFRCNLGGGQRACSGSDITFLAYYTLNGFSLPGGREKMIEEVLNANIWVGLIVNFIIVEWIILKRDDSKM